MSDVLVIGGGSAGMFAGARLSEMGLGVTVLEPTGQTLRKLRISGKGRCNLTNNCTVEQVMKNVIRNPKFLYSALDNLSPQDTMRWFESHGVPLKTERGGRVFPVSDRASDVAAALEKSNSGIVKDRAVRILTENGAVTGVLGERGEYHAPAVILATGGRSYPKTGSTGDGYRLAGDLGHTISEPKASLVPIETKERFSEELYSLTIKNVTLSLYGSKKKPIYSELGEMSFARYGIAGPLSLSASCFIDDKSDYKIVIDLKPGLTMEQLIKRIQRDFDETPNLPFCQSLGKLFPRELRPDMVRLSGIDPNKPCNQITREEKEALAKLTKSLTLTVTGLRPIEEGIVTRGGIRVSEINPKTMESKLVSGLYFAGEIIDCDGMTGGYNLQIAFSTAETAALAISRKKGEAIWE
ncbi:MAG: NAD(P)/FAD-dependent oxidoreductase [Oscillospiraceae bacterium]|nr:NAD(P)/FAD-dependent oxidoreductase [Oscillospiraceae bacterium]